MGRAAVPLSIGSTVKFTPAVAARSGLPGTATARGMVVSFVGTHCARVDFRGSWLPREDGSTVRTLPLANITRA